ncbi:MAG: FadR/GntR family transcriptional regulator [Gaiellales bacterium]
MLDDVADGLKEPQRLSQQLTTLLAAEIVSGRLEPGSKFPSTEAIVTRFAVSRTVARETVQGLAMLGLVSVQHGKRTEILPPEEWDILSSTVQEALRREGRAEPLLHDLYEFRMLIEPHAASLMARNATDAEVAELSRLATEMEEIAASDGATRSVLVADREFHNLVARAGGNRVVLAVSRDIREILGTLWGYSKLGPAELKDVARQHRKLADAIGKRDGEAAAEAMREHLAWASQADLHDLRDSGAGAGG